MTTAVAAAGVPPGAPNLAPEDTGEPRPQPGNNLNVDAMDVRVAEHAAYNAGAADPRNTGAIADGLETREAVDTVDELARPSTFRKILEVAEIIARSILPGISSIINLISALLRVARLIFKPSADDDLLKEMARLGIDVLGIFMPLASLLHVGLNSYWGGTSPSDTELLAGWDRWLLPDQEGQDLWIAGGIRRGFRAGIDFVTGGDEPEAEVVNRIEGSTAAPTRGFIETAPLPASAVERAAASGVSAPVAPLEAGSNAVQVMM